jgi:hypothetical protein
MDLSEPSPMFRAPTPISFPVDINGGPPSLPERPPFMHNIGDDPLFHFSRDRFGNIIWPSLERYATAPVTPQVICLMQLPVRSPVNIFKRSRLIKIFPSTPLMAAAPVSSLAAVALLPSAVLPVLPALLVFTTAVLRTVSSS